MIVKTVNYMPHMMVCAQARTGGGGGRRKELDKLFQNHAVFYQKLGLYP